MRFRLALRGFALMAVLACSKSHVVAQVGQVHLYGGPGTIEGRFEDALGNIDMQGWIGVDCPEIGFEPLWQVSDFQAENLNSHGPGNHAIWAGRTAEQRPSWADAPGYGDNWNTVLQWSQVAPTTVAAFDVQLDAALNHDTEDFYDPILVEWNQAGVWQSLGQFEDTSADEFGVFQPPGVAMFFQWTVQPEDLVDDEVQIRLRATSDPIVSDESGTVGAALGDSDGAIQIDDITVSFDGVPVDGGGDADGVATFESGDDESWMPQPDTCACSIVSELADDMDPGPDNLTPQVGLFRSASYPGTQALTCRFTSPVIDWNVPEAEGFDAGLLRLRSYRESSGSDGSWAVFIRSRVGGVWQNYRVLVSVAAPPAGWQTFNIIILEDEHVPIAAEAIQLFVRSSSNSTEYKLTFDDIEIVRYDSSITPVRPTASAHHIELDVYPNPTNPAATIRYVLQASSPVEIALFDARGRKVREIFAGTKPAGTHTLKFDGQDDAGKAVASGVYYVQLMSEGRAYSDRVVIVR